MNGLTWYTTARGGMALRLKQRMGRAVQRVSMMLALLLAGSGWAQAAAEAETLGISAKAYAKRFNELMAESGKAARLDLSKAEKKANGGKMLTTPLGEHANMVLTFSEKGEVQGVIVLAAGGGGDEAVIDGATVGFAALTAVLPDKSMKAVMTEMNAVVTTEGAQKTYGPLMLKVEPMSKLGFIYSAGRTPKPVEKPAGQKTFGLTLQDYASGLNQQMDRFGKPYRFTPGKLSKGPVNDTVSAKFGDYVSMIVGVAKNGEVSTVSVLGDFDGSVESAQEIYELAAIGLSSTSPDVAPEKLYEKLRDLKQDETLNAGDASIAMNANESIVAFSADPR